MRCSSLVVWLSIGSALSVAACSGNRGGRGPSTDGGSAETGGEDATLNDSGAPDASRPDGNMPMPGVFRAFSSDSPWNTPIPENPALDPASSQLIDHFATSSEWPFLGFNLDSHGIPVYWIDSTQVPMVPVQVNSVAGRGFDVDSRAPIPVGARPDPESDAHLAIVDPTLGIEWGFFGAYQQGSSWFCDVCATADLNGTGVRPPKDGNQDWFISHGARACGFPLIAGLVTVEEMQAGRIDHALAIAYPGIRSRYYTPPASTAQTTFGPLDPNRGIPCGGRIQLDPALDLDSLGLSPSGRIIAEALQRYGAFVADFSGAVSLYAENSPEAQAVWASGLLDTYEIREQIDLRSFRVLEMGRLYDDMN